MIPLGLKETKMIDLRDSFKDFILEHYSEDANEYEDAIADFMDTRQVRCMLFNKIYILINIAWIYLYLKTIFLVSILHYNYALYIFRQYAHHYVILLV